MCPTYTDDGLQKHLNLGCLQKKKGQSSALEGYRNASMSKMSTKQTYYFLADFHPGLQPTCMSSSVLMAVRKCSFDLLQFTSF